MFKPNLKTVFALIGVSAIFTSCASIVAGGSPLITIDGNVREPVTIVTEKQTYADVSLPAKVKVNRHHIEGQKIQVSTKTKSFRDIYLSKATNPWAFGNILIGGLIGWGIDLSTNAVSQPSQTVFYVDEATGRDK